MLDDGRQADADAKSKTEEEIEVTPAMIEVGASVLWNSGAVETPMEDVDRALVRQIFVAMTRASKSPP
jgi:hypothetical protein